MKNFGMVLTLTLTLTMSIASQLSAQDVNSLSLKNNMKQGAIIFKQVSASINDASKNQENAASIAKMIGYFETAKTQSPDSVTNGSLLDYQTLIGQEIQNLHDLQSALLKNDNVAALSIVQKINTVKKEGHDKYK